MFLKDLKRRYLDFNRPFESCAGAPGRDPRQDGCGAAARRPRTSSWPTTAKVLTAGIPMPFRGDGDSSGRPGTPASCRKFPLASRGRVYAVGGIVTDITDRKRAEESLRQLSSRLFQMQDEERDGYRRDLQEGVATLLDALRSQLIMVKDWEPAGLEDLRCPRPEPEAWRRRRSRRPARLPPVVSEASSTTRACRALRWVWRQLLDSGTGVKVVRGTPARLTDACHATPERLLFRSAEFPHERAPPSFGGKHPPHGAPRGDAYAIRSR